VRPFLLLAAGTAFLALASASRPADAESHAATLVRLLDAPGRSHPLADGDGRIPVSVALPPFTEARSFGLLEVAPGVGTIRLAPGEVAAFAAAHPDLSLGVAPRSRPMLDVSAQWTRVGTFRTSTGGVTGKRVIVGVVDTGLDVRHPDFRTKDGHSRVAWLLAAGPPAGLHPDLEQQFGCTDPQQSPCAIYAAADLDHLITSGGDTPGDSEGHGTHVASIAAGNGGPSVNASPRFVGLAPEATLVVAAPSMTSGFSDPDILRGTRFVFDRAATMGLPAGCAGDPCRPGPCTDPKQCSPAPVVVNLSLGSDYGAHDGTSNLERGLLSLLGNDVPGRAIVVAAGNSGELVDPGDGSGPFGIHTEVHVDDDELVRVPMVAMSAVMDGQVFVWVAFRPGDDVAVGLEGPGRKTWVGLTGSGQQAGYQGGGDTGGVVNNLPQANGAITPDTNSAVVVFSGHWDNTSEFAVLLRGHGDASLWLTAQKDADQALFFERAVRQGTINVPASAPGLLAVGCTVNRLKWKPLDGQPVELGALGDDPQPVTDSACFFSADGPTPTGVPKPEINAPGAFVAAAMSTGADPRKNPGGLFDLAGCPQGSPYCALLDDQHAVAVGTSMSAPQVAGAVALLFDLDVQTNGTSTLTQSKVTRILQAGARHPRGHVPDRDQIGPGALDVEGARQSFLDSISSAAPVPAASWYTLSSAYARPDESWPVWGTVELRQSDGLVPTVDERRLALVLLQGGAVYQPLTQVRPGLWLFAVAGRAADLGSTITFDVRYAGVSLGETTLPVGRDVWVADDASTSAAGGGCSASSGARPGRGLAAFGALALATALGRRRRRGRAGMVESRGVADQHADVERRGSGR
jgi:subtilisin family serine protease